MFVKLLAAMVTLRSRLFWYMQMSCTKSSIPSSRSTAGWRLHICVMVLMPSAMASGGQRSATKALAMAFIGGRRSSGGTSSCVACTRKASTCVTSVWCPVT